MIVPTILLGCYCLLLALGAIQDIARSRISNSIVIAVFIVTLISVGVRVQPSLWWEYGLSFALALVGSSILFSWGWIGGGDAKFFSAAALWFDLNGLAIFLASVAIVGGIIALAVLSYRIVGSGVQGFRRGIMIPYGAPIAIAAIGLAIMGAAIKTAPANDLFRSRINFVSGSEGHV
jgi:prepilin peptidase CpaA